MLVIIIVNEINLCLFCEKKKESKPLVRGQSNKKNFLKKSISKYIHSK